MEQNSDYRSQWNQPLFIIQHEMDLNIFFLKVDKGSSESVNVTISAGNKGRANSFFFFQTKCKGVSYSVQMTPFYSDLGTEHISFFHLI